MRDQACLHHLLGVALSAALAAVAIVAAAEQAAPARPPSDGLLRSELSMGGRTATLAFAPSLTASDPAHAALLSDPPRAGGGRIRVGHLETTGTLRISTKDLARRDDGTTSTRPQPGTPGPQGPPPAVRYDLWLDGVADGWRLQLTDSDNEVAAEVSLARQAATPASPTLVAALLPEDTISGRLVLRWGGYQGTADLSFVNPTRRRLEDNRPPNETINRRHDEDTSVLSRARLLAQRNETALVLSNGSRISLSFQRTFARGEGANTNRTSRGLSVDGPDFARLLATPSGAVVMLTESPVPRLRVERPLRFGKTTLAIGNHVTGFPGSYGIWLKRAGSEWRLVFNHEPDVWGSQHDPKSDAGEIDLTHSEGPTAGRPFAVALVPTAADRGRLVLIWGPHEWTADFVVLP